jgi:hypothetical protein
MRTRGKAFSGQHMNLTTYQFSKRKEQPFENNQSNVKLNDSMHINTQVTFDWASSVDWHYTHALDQHTTQVLL